MVQNGDGTVLQKLNAIVYNFVQVFNWQVVARVYEQNDVKKYCPMSLVKGRETGGVILRKIFI